MHRISVFLNVEEMETRTVPTVLGTLPLGMGAPVLPLAQQSPTHATQHIFGTIQGNYAVLDPIGVDAGIGAGFWGSGRLDFLGSVQLTGSLHGTGDIARGQANGEITLTNARGSVTLELVGSEQGMFAPLPQEFHFSVVSATGAYQGLQMTGSVDLAQHPDGSFKMTFESVKFHDAKALAGKGHGDFTVGNPQPDVGTLYRLNGSASVGLLGQVTISGSVQTTGFIHVGHATGELTLTNGQGTVTLRLTGPEQPGFASLPEHFHFSVVGATGAYKGLKVTGEIDLRLDPIVWMASKGGQSKPLPAPWEGGGFHFTLHPQVV